MCTKRWRSELTGLVPHRKGCTRGKGVSANRQCWEGTEQGAVVDICNRVCRAAAPAHSNVTVRGFGMARVTVKYDFSFFFRLPVHTGFGHGCNYLYFRLVTVGTNRTELVLCSTIYGPARTAAP